MILGLIIEYKTGFFQHDATEASPINKQFIFAQIMVISFIGLFIFLFGTLKIAFLPFKHLRESFSLYSVLLVTFVFLVDFEIFVFGFMPWFVPQIFYSNLKDASYTAPTLGIGDYLLTLVIFILTLIILSWTYKSWYGLFSIVSYQNSQRGKSSNIFIEGWREILRIVKREPPLAVYRSENTKFVLKKLSVAVDSLNWQGQAQKLVSLSSPAYYFDIDSGWHDKPGCWLGHFLNNSDELVFLKPAERNPSKRELQDFVEYAKKISARDEKKVGEVIVATRSPIKRKSQVDREIRINFVSENELLDSLIDFSAYFSDITKRFLNSSLPDSNLTLNDIYTPSYCKSSETQKQPIPVEDFLNGWIREPGNRQIALLGEYGQGKSTTSLAWAYNLINQPGSPRIPILIELRGTSPRDLTDLEFLGAWATKYNISPQALMRLIIAGRIVLIFEGFDEMALIGNTEMRLKHFNTLWAFAFDKSKILITGRPNLFLDDQEKKAALGVDKPHGNEPYCEAFHLQPFTPEQIADSLRAFDSEIRDSISKLAKTNKRFYELVARPSLLYIVATLWNRYQLADKIDKLTSAYVMELFVRHSYRRQGAKQSDQRGYLGLTSLEREYFMEGIATYMFANLLPNQIQNYQLNEAIAKLIESIPDSVSTASTSITDETRVPLKGRISDLEFGVELIKTDVRACGLLVADPSSAGTFKFGHKSFMEYLFASVLAESFAEESSEASSVLLSTFDVGVMGLRQSKESLGFFAELLVERVCSQLKQSESQKVQIAKLLFIQIIGNLTFSFLLNRKLMFVVYKIRQRSQILLIILHISTFLPVMFGSFYLLEYFRYFGLIRGQTFYLNQVVFWVAFTLVGLIPYSAIGAAVKKLPRFGLWLLICDEAKIPDEDVKASLGISGTSFLRNLSVD